MKTRKPNTYDTCTWVRKLDTMSHFKYKGELQYVHMDVLTGRLPPAHPLRHNDAVENELESPQQQAAKDTNYSVAIIQLPRCHWSILRNLSETTACWENSTKRHPSRLHWLPPSWEHEHMWTCTAGAEPVCTEVSKLYPRRPGGTLYHVMNCPVTQRTYGAKTILVSWSVVCSNISRHCSSHRCWHSRAMSHHASSLSFLSGGCVFSPSSHC